MQRVSPSGPTAHTSLSCLALQAFALQPFLEGLGLYFIHVHLVLLERQWAQGPGAASVRSSLRLLWLRGLERGSCPDVKRGQEQQPLPWVLLQIKWHPSWKAPRMPPSAWWALQDGFCEHHHCSWWCCYRTVSRGLGCFCLAWKHRRTMQCVTQSPGPTALISVLV